MNPVLMVFAFLALPLLPYVVSRIVRYWSEQSAERRNWRRRQRQLEKRKSQPTALTGFDTNPDEIQPTTVTYTKISDKLPRPQVITTTLRVVEENDVQHVPKLLEILESGSIPQRAAAADALGQIGDPSAVEGLIKALLYREAPPSFRDQYDAVRYQAAGALGKIGDESALPPLIECLFDPNRGIRRLSAWALGRMGGEIAVWGLSDALNGEQDSEVRWAIVDALNQIGDPEALKVISEWKADRKASE